MPPRLGLRILAVFVADPASAARRAAASLSLRGRRRAGEGRGRGLDQGRLRAARVHAVGRDRRRGAPQQRHPGHRVQAAGRCHGRPHCGGCVELRRRGAARSGRRAPCASRSPARSPSTRWLRARSCSSIFCPKAGPACRPSLPQEVVEELARRAREAEKKARQQLVTAQQRALPPVRVRVGMQPTFTRYTFALAGADRRFRPSAATTRSTFTFEAPMQASILPTCRPRCRRRSRGIEAQSGHDEHRRCASNSSARSTCARSARTTITSSTSCRSGARGEG